MASIRSRDVTVAIDAAILVPCLFTGGTEVATLETALALKALGHDVEVVVYFNEVDATMLDAFKSSGLPVHLLSVQRGNGVRRQWRLALALLRLLLQRRYGLVWVQYMTPTLLPLVVARLFSHKLVACVHVAASHYSDGGLRRLRWLARHWCTRLVCVSQTVANGIFGPEGGADRAGGRVVVIPNALDMRQMEGAVVRNWRAELGWPQESVVVGFAGRLAHIKGADVLLQAMARLCEWGMLVRLVLVGDGAEQANLKALAQQLNISHVTHFAGRLPRTEVYGAIKGFDIAAVPSREEGFGLSALEAMAAGVSVVASQVDALQEVVQDGVTGLLCQVNDPVSLANALARLVTDSPYRQSMGRAGMAHVVRFYGAPVQRARLADFCDGMGLPDQAVEPPPAGPVVFVYQRMLPYHEARFKAVAEVLRRQGQACVALEVASFDRAYGQFGDATAPKGTPDGSVTCLFPGADYLDLTPQKVTGAVLAALQKLAPVAVFAPAPAFAEGAGALHYKVRHGGRLVLMDDAWSTTDQRGWLTREVKSLFYGYVDGGFFPDHLHGDYFAKLNIPHERQRYAVDVVGPVSANSGVPQDINKAEPYLLFVGRLIQLKGLDVLLKAIAGLTAPVHLVVIGDGPDREALQTLSTELGLDARVQWLGRRSNTEARHWMAHSQAVLVPSKFETWGLVVNEAWMAPTVVLGSETVGALRASAAPDRAWMLVGVGDVKGWQAALSRLMALPPDERAVLLSENQKLAAKYSLATHVQSALALAHLPLRKRPPFPIAWMARAWKGKVAVW